MPREVPFFDALFPTLMFAFVAAGICLFALDWWFTRKGVYRHVWYPALFRFSIFMILFSVLGLCIY